MDVMAEGERSWRPEERLRVLSEATRAFAEATADWQGLLDTIARQLGEVLKTLCLVRLLSEDGKTLTLASLFDPDPVVLDLARVAFANPALLEELVLTRQVLETGEPLFIPRVELERMSRTPSQIGRFELLERLGMHSLIVVALRVRDRLFGELVLFRFRRTPLAFDEQDLALVQSLASHAALALSNAQLLAEMKREKEEGQRVAKRLHILEEAAREFSAATYDHEVLLEVVARRIGTLFGDMCAIRSMSEDRQWVEPKGAAYHRDPELMAAAQSLLLSSRQRVGEGVSGQVIASGQPLLTQRLEPSAFVAVGDPRHWAFFERLGVTSSITLPLFCRGEVVGVLNLLRSLGQPYSEDDLRFVQSVADHAALALSNARAYAAEREAREVAERATIALRHVEGRFRRLAESGVIGILVTSMEGLVLEINDALLAMVGYSRDDFLSGRVAWLSLTPPDWEHVDLRAIEQLKATGIGSLREKECVRKDGSRVPILVGSAMLDGGVEGAISFVLDLTERKEALSVVARLKEERAADEKFRGLLESAPDAMVIVDHEGRIVIVNGQVEKLFGYPREALLGQAIEMLIPERFRQVHPVHRAAYLRRHETRSMGLGLGLHGRRQNGSEFPIEVSLSPLETPGGLLVSSAIRDLTERHAIEEQRARLAAIVESSADAIIGSALDGTITSWNQAAQRLFGYSAEEIVGQHFGMLFPPGESEESERESVGRGEERHFDGVRLCKDGHELSVSVTVSPVRDARGQVVGLSKVARDITVQKRAEAALAGALESAEASSRELEAFSYSVAHDLRAPLRGMNGFAQVLLDSYGAQFDEEGRDWLQEILLNAHKMGALIDALLSLSRLTRSELKRESVDLSAVARAVAAQLRASDPERRVEVVIEEGLHAELDPTLARALVDNLLGNAWKFTHHTPEARIEVGVTDPGGVPTFFVRDNGAGFDMAYASKLFAPFQRLHSATEFPGTGIGLATVQRIVRRHGGRIWAEGVIGRGATFWFTFSNRTTGAP